MLCDDIKAAAAGATPDDVWYDTWNTLAARIQASERLVLRRDVVQTAMHLSCTRPSSMADTVEMALPPYPSTWIEWADADKAEVLVAFGLRNISGARHPARVGALIQQPDPEAAPHVFTIEYAWTHGGPDQVNVSVAAFQVDVGPMSAQTLKKVPEVRQDIEEQKHIQGNYWSIYADKPKELDGYAEVMARFEIVPAPSAARDMTHLIRHPHSEPHARRIFNGNIGDCHSEALFTLSVLLLFNTLNATRTTREDLSKLNKARAKRKQPPLFEHEHVVMRLSKPERDEMAGGPGRGGVRGGPKAAHICRGHYKKLVRPDGSKRLVWWRAHWRGHGAAPASGRTRQVAL